MHLLFIGTYNEDILFGTGEVMHGLGQGIHALLLDLATGGLTPATVTHDVRNPSFVTLSPDRRFLYAVNELKEWDGQFGGGLSAFAVDGATGALRFINSKPSRGTDPCHVAVHRDGQFVLVANYSSGSVIVYRLLQDGGLGEETDFVQHHGSSVNDARQEGPHAHQVMFDGTGTWAFVPELGVDRLMVYRFDAVYGKLLPAAEPWVATEPGAGPRHVALHPHAPYLYLINELDCTVSTFLLDSATGGLKLLQSASTHPKGYTGLLSCAEIRVSADGRFVYGSNRDDNSIAVFSVDPASGWLTLIGDVDSGGQVPRNFALSPDGEWMIVANQDSHNVLTYRMNKLTGTPQPTGVEVRVGSPVCVCFY